ncbi:hypothetical protein C8R44DRAFT_798367, partial [Mycena epipterygia]
MLLIYAFPVAPAASAPSVLAWTVSVFLLIHPSIFAVRVIHLVSLLSISCRCSFCTVPTSASGPILDTNPLQPPLSLYTYTLGPSLKHCMHLSVVLPPVLYSHSQLPKCRESTLPRRL